MSDALNLAHGASLNGSGRNKSVEVSGADVAVTVYPFTVGNGVSDKEVVIPISRARLKGIYVESDQEVTCKLNSDSAPDDTWTVKANKPTQWHVDGFIPNPLPDATDVTTTYWSNAGATTATVYFYVAQDVSP